MIVALVHWRIKPDEKSISDFLRFWREDATIADRGELVGEFLSEVATPKEFSYITWHLDPESLGNYKSFVNVAFWNDAAAFYEQVARNFNDDNPMKPFEMYRRRRVILKPDSRRMGAARLPEDDFPANVK